MTCKPHQQSLKLRTALPRATSTPRTLPAAMPGLNITLCALSCPRTHGCCFSAVFLHSASGGAWISTIPTSSTTIGASRAKCSLPTATTLWPLLQQLPHCRFIVTTGQKATETICQYFCLAEAPKVGCYVAIPHLKNGYGLPISLYRLPSSSRAYPLSFDKKAAAYRQMFAEAEML